MLALISSVLQLSHTAAQAEWNQIKSDEKVVQQKIDEYMETFKASSAAGLPPNEDDDQPKKTRGRKKKSENKVEKNKATRPGKRGRKRAHSSDYENELLNENEHNEENGNDDDEENDDDDDSNSKKAPPKIRTAAEILAKKSKAPAQDKVAKELYEINERIIQLVQVKNMGMATAEQEKQLKKLLVEQKKKSNDLKRLKAEQAAKKRYREAKKVRETSPQDKCNRSTL